MILKLIVKLKNKENGSKLAKNFFMNPLTLKSTHMLNKQWH